MWDESLPAYSGSLEDQVTLFMIYLRYGIFYAIVLLGIISIAIALISPIFIAYFSIDSFKIKITQKKNKQQIKQLKNDEDFYINRLEQHLKKKNKKKK
jgi:hypothetical protein